MVNDIYYLARQIHYIETPSVVLFRSGSLEAVVLKRPVETVKQPQTVKPST